MWFYIMIVTLLFVLIWLTQVREDFIDGSQDPEDLTKGLLQLQQGMPDIGTLPDPGALIIKMRDLLAKYDKPEMINGIIQRSNKDPGQLARMHLGIDN